MRNHPHRLLAVAVLVAAALGASGCQTLPVAEDTEDPTELARRAAFEPSEGMSRAEVESVLGYPTHMGATKEGHTICHYQFGLHWKSVVYDNDEHVVSVYR